MAYAGDMLHCVEAENRKVLPQTLSVLAFDPRFVEAVGGPEMAKLLAGAAIEGAKALTRG